MKRILDETQNFIRLYEHSCGDTEVPPTFNLWACLSLIAACVASRVWFEKFKGGKLTPNLYTILIGPSGLGKGQAIDTASRLLTDVPRVNMYRGKASAPYLIDYMGKPRRNESGKWVIENSKVYLVTPELSMSVGSGPLADAFIKHMTELFSGGDYLFQEGTRTRGGVQFRNHCINWIAGTTVEWLKDSITKDAVSGGFFARVITVKGEYDFGKRILRPVESAPPDFDEVFEHLRARVRMLTVTEGQFRMTSQAAAIEEQWYMNRPEPDDDVLAPAWKRAHDIVLKLAMVLSLAEGEELVIDRKHIVFAERLVRDAHRHLPSLIAFASTTPETASIQVVAEAIKKAGEIHHSPLLKRVTNRGVNGELLREAVNHLLQTKQIKQYRTPSGSVVYVWRGGARMPLE